MIEEASLTGGDGRQPIFESPRTVHLSLAAGETVPAHRHPERSIVFAVVRGELALTVGDETVQLSAAEVVRFDGDADIAVEAESDVDALVVLAES